jgi:hypothetical protein
MALRTPPSWLQNGSHPAENDRLTTQALYSTTGTIGASSLAITAQASPNMTVNAATGWCAIAGSTAGSGVYVAYNDATTVLTITTANPTLPRIDRIVVTVSDAYYSGSTNTVAFSVIAGTAAASPTAPATPSNSISLATIAVAAAATTITAANITDTRTGITSSSFLPLTGGTVSGATTFSNAVTIGGTLQATSPSFSGTASFINLSLAGDVTSSGTVTAQQFVASAGTASYAPFKMTTGTVLTTPVTGTFEFDNGFLSYFTPEGTYGKRGLLGVDYYQSIQTATSLGSVTTAQNMFGSNITLAIGRYEFEIMSALSTGSTAHNTSFGWAGTATVTQLFATAIASQGSPAATTNTVITSTPTSLFSGTSTATTTPLIVKGHMYLSSAGTWIPQVTFSVAPGGTNTVVVNSSIRVRRINNSVSGVLVGNWV